MTVVVVVCSVLLVVAAALTLVRLERGPSMLDRTVALDILVTVLVAGVALYAAVERRTDVVPVLVALSLVGFVGSTTIARFAYLEPEGEGRVRSREEVRAEEEERRRREAAELEAHRAAVREAVRAAEAGRGEAGHPPVGEEHGGGAEGEVR
ncbi:monovalent cation/H+ antiporter complex subunit F [Cellulomonas endophytica]|uniref:monovalent cation/H+ antiporter complex subunit F n=1 Tax=Cellulomonas endophytica TaxID=2494735 RepID=UPI001010284A|nr:monovalent cation/H+ antiporter complex subunit F [Cellulomonas endophytica]